MIKTLIKYLNEKYIHICIHREIVVYRTRDIETEPYMARRGKEMNKDEDEEGTEHHHPWGTLEELLLACAVSRHGAKSWDSVATELQKRASSASHHHHHLRAASVYSPPNCKQRYHDLLRRFSAVDGDDALVDELKKLRVAELRREVERHDVSIE